MKSVRIFVTEPFMDYYDQIAEIPASYQLGRTLQSGRNLITKFKINQNSGKQLDIVVKAFAKPGKIKGFVNANIAQNKAKKSILNAEYLLKLGISTPEPIASIENFKFLCIRESFYVCRFWYHNYNLGDFLYRGVSSGVNTQFLLENLCQFTAEQHNKGILHLDYNPWNILVRVKEDSFNFALVDLNRVRITNLRMQDRIRGLIRLALIPETISIIGSIYAKQIGVDQNAFRLRLLAEHRKFWTKRIRFENWVGILKNNKASTKRV